MIDNIKTVDGLIDLEEVDDVAKAIQDDLDSQPDNQEVYDHVQSLLNEEPNDPMPTLIDKYTFIKQQMASSVYEQKVADIELARWELDLELRTIENSIGLIYDTEILPAYRERLKQWYLKKYPNSRLYRGILKEEEEASKEVLDIVNRSIDKDNPIDNE